ncbi:MAG TPA: trimeric intracellular cation channel family protein [Gemmatimonadales bacterium]|nr:trimeric intracellular cation channel family protein [Gemmatimonadales bacterium]
MTTLYLLDLIGVAIFAISGALTAGRKGLDFLGVIIIATVTAIGGGTVRDLLLDRHPVFWIDDPAYLIVIICSALATLVWVRYHTPEPNSLLLADALGLAVFTIIGAQIAEAAGVSPGIVVIMATMTGVAGGVIRDVLSNEIPLILRRDIYATAAMAGAGLYLILQRLGADQRVAVGAGMVAVTLLRLLAIYRGLRLPVLRLPADPS